jgi:ATP-dependent Clp protease protease subunit
MDVIELMGVPVHALCLGQVGGPAIGVLSVCHHRAAMPSTRFSWREPTTRLETRAREVEQWAQWRSDERQRFTERVAAAVGKPADLVAATLEKGTFMTAQEAHDFGLIDEICRPKGEIRQLPGPPIGFRPRR